MDLSLNYIIRWIKLLKKFILDKIVTFCEHKIKEKISIAVHVSRTSIISSTS